MTTAPAQPAQIELAAAHARSARARPGRRADLPAADGRHLLYTVPPGGGRVSPALIATIGSAGSRENHVTFERS